MTELLLKQRRTAAYLPSSPDMESDYRYRYILVPWLKEEMASVTMSQEKFKRVWEMFFCALTKTIFP
jgi:hypothetical protein